MLSTEDLERLITKKRHDIQQEKTSLGLSPINNNVEINEKIEKTGRLSRPRALSENNVPAREAAAREERPPFEEEISPDLERYIRRYAGLPAMLKAGEYSPNNPLIRGERSSGDVLLGLGEYERRRNTLRKIRQRQYKEYLDQQAKKKQEAKEQAERERKEREEKERLREERERQRLELERIDSPERRRASVSNSYISGANNTYISKVDTGIQVDHRSTPLSVAVQTDDETLFRINPPSAHNLLTQAERELSPHTVGDGKEPQCDSHRWDWKTWDRSQERRRSYGDYDERSMTIARKPRDRLASELRHTYMPSIFDAEAIKLRNEQAEKEAAERRHSYQQELKNQILEQQRIKEERKTREKMLEQAEMRRLEEQLRSLETAQKREIDKHHDINAAMKSNASEYDRKRSILQKEIDLEHQALLKAAVHPKRNTNTSKSESPINTKLPFLYKFDDKPPHTANVHENTIFPQSYDVETYLRRNLNPPKENLESMKMENVEKINHKKNTITEKALVHDNPKENMERSYGINTRKSTENSERSHNRCEGLRKMPEIVGRVKIRDTKPDDTLPIPVLRHSPNSPKQRITFEEKTSDLSEKMQIVDDKWKVPAVQKNILKSLPNDKGKNVSILTQLGSIRRQLQLEQLKLDKMLSENHNN